MKKIIFIPAKKSLKNSEKLKVAAYCRVSTERETQKSSIDAQIKYYNDLIQENGILQVYFMITKVVLEKRNGMVWVLCLKRYIVVKLIISLPSLSVDCPEMC